MTDPKRRILPPPMPLSRAQTPQPGPTDAASQDRKRSSLSFGSTLSNVASMPDLKRASGKRPRIVQRASQYLVANYGKPKEPNYFIDIEPQDFEQPVPLEHVLDSLQSDLMANSLKPLRLESNGPILRILEGYMKLKAEHELLSVKIESLSRQHDENVDTLEFERKTWKQDEEMYKAEIKRLEILIAEGRTGLSQVALARQQSLVRGMATGRPRPSSSKSDTTMGFASVASSNGSTERLKVQVIRPTTPSLEMKQLSRSIKAHRSFLSLNFLPERPPSRMRGLSLADVDIPRHWRKKSEATSGAPSIASSPRKAFDSDDDFSSTGGDLLPDEIEQHELDKQAIQHVAKLMAARTADADTEDKVRQLEACIAGHLDLDAWYQPTPRSRRPSTPQSGHSSEDMPTIRAPKGLAARRGTGPLHIETENVLPSRHSRRPFSFYAGDDQTIMADLRTAPAQFPYRDSSIPSAKSPQDIPLKRHGSLIPSPVPEHVMAKARREDSSSSVITSLQRSPIGTIGNFGIAGGSNSGATRQSSVLGDKSNDRAPVTPRMASTSGSVRSTLTTRRVKPKVQAIVQDIEMKGKVEDGEEMEGGQKTSSKKSSRGIKQRSSGKQDSV